ncbi:MAG: hypothetical protein GX224_03275 [Thermoplasmatales archaeon]|nr:hypothetical protein [Thermoplasmatales archaeon]
MNAKPDGFIGAIMAIEGIADADIVLHGPNGCRKNLAVLSRKSYPKPRGETVAAGTPFYGEFPRVPCTEVTPPDYIYGSYNRITAALGRVGLGDSNLIAVSCSPGMSLIGDDCWKAVVENEMEDRAVILDTSFASEPLCRGFDSTLADVVRALEPEGAETREGTVNLLGLSVLQKDWESVVDEFRKLFSAMGLEVLCVLGAGCTVADIRESFSAERNVVLCPEYSVETSTFYDERGVKPISLGHSPVGFDATEGLVRLVGNEMGTDCAKAVSLVDEYRRRAFSRLSAVDSGLKGKTFAIETDASVAYPLAKWLFESFSMVPVSINLYESGHWDAVESLTGFLGGLGLGDAMGADVPEGVDYLLCDGNSATIAEAAGFCGRGIDIRFPSITNVDFRPSPIFGARGAMYLLDRIVNPF